MLDLSHNTYIGEKGFIEIGTMLKTNTTLTKIYLAGLTGGNMGDRRIIEGIKLNQQIIEADLGCVGDTGLAYFGDNFHQMVPLKH